MSFTRTKSVLRDPKADLVTIEIEVVGNDGKVKKTKKIQMKRSEYNPKALFDARKKHLG